MFDEFQVAYSMKSDISFIVNFCVGKDSFSLNQ